MQAGMADGSISRSASFDVFFLRGSRHGALQKIHEVFPQLVRRVARDWRRPDGE